MILGPGFHRIDKETYLADPCAAPSLSSSIASILVRQSPHHAWAAHPRLGARRPDPTAAMIAGTVLDSLLVGGDSELVELPEAMPNAKGTLVPTNDKFLLESAKAWRDEQLAAGRVPIGRFALNEARIAADIIGDRLKVRHNIDLKALQHQVTGIWDADRVWCRLRMDAWDEATATIYDIKKTVDASPTAIQRHMDTYDYDLSHAHYVAGVEAIRPDLAGRVRMVFLFVEDVFPYEVAKAHPSGTLRATGEHKHKKALRLWGECLATGKWAGYSDGELEVDALPWRLSEMEADLAGGSEGAPF